MKKNIMYLLLWMSILSCSWENEETLFPGAGICDTSSVSFANDITPILANNCFACHSNLNAPQYASGITLEDHGDVAASANLIVGTINHTEGFSKMPKNSAKLDACLINFFEAWVNQGSSDN